jgi:dynein heavy chain 1
MTFEEAVNEVMEKTQVIEDYLNELGQCEIQREALLLKLKNIQKIIDEFNFQEFSNLNTWVEELDQRIQNILTQRLEEVVQLWVTEFNKF